MKRLRYKTPEKDFLAYAGDPVEYLEVALDRLLPEENIDLLRHLTHFGAFVDELMTRLPCDGLSLADLVTREETSADRVNLQQAMNLAWRWNSEIIGRAQPLVSLYAYAVLLSWSAVCHIFYLNLFEHEERYEACRRQCADDYEFYRRVSLQHHMDISAGPLSTYTVSDLWDSVRFITVYGLYTEPYDEAMKRYLQALFFHYCSLLCVKHDDIGSLLDNPRFVAFGESQPLQADTIEKHRAHEELTIEVAPGYRLKSAFLYEGELLFQNQLYRTVLSDVLIGWHEENPLILRDAGDEQRHTETNDDWLNFMHSICEDARLGNFLVSDFKENAMQLQLFHGETERFRRQWPEATCQPSDVLAMSRPSDHIEAGRLHQMSPLALCDAYQQSGQYEREAFFLTRQATIRWLAYKRVKCHKTVDSLIVLEELYEVNDLMAIIIREEREMPLVLRLMCTYYVVNGSSVYKTRHFRDAYFVWLSLLAERDETLLAKLPHSLQHAIDCFSVI